MKTIELTQGQSEKLRVTIDDDLTNGTLRLLIKAKKEDADADAIYDEEITSFDAPGTGIQDIDISATDTASFEIGSYYGQVKYVNNTNQVYFDEIVNIRIIKTIYDNGN